MRDRGQVLCRNWDCLQVWGPQHAVPVLTLCYPTEAAPVAECPVSILHFNFWLPVAKHQEWGSVPPDTQFAPRGC